MALEVTLLGPPRVERDGQPVTFDTRKAMALLALLALSERPRSREALCELLWPGHDPEHARGALRRTLSTLRKAVGEDWIDTAGDSIALMRGSGPRARRRALPRARGRRCLARQPERGGDAVLRRLPRGLRTSRQPGLRRLADRARPALLERELATALRRLVQLLAARGEYAQAIPYARRWLEVDPLHEPAHRELIRLYAWSGDRAAALEQYRNCVRTLSQELGVAPLEETAALYEQVNDGSLAPPPEALAPSAPPTRAKAAGAPPDLPLVGRAEALATLTDAHAGARPDGGLAVIEGEAGIGKTRLANELAGRVQAGGAVVLAVRCHDDEAGLPYGPVVELLREAVRNAAARRWPDSVPAQRLADAALLLPELAALRSDVPDPLPLDGPGAQVRMLEGVAAVLSAACEGPAPGLVFLDDVHAADEATLDAVTYLGRRLRDRPCCS